MSQVGREEKKNENEFQLKSDMKWHRVNKFTSISLTPSILYHCYKTYISYFTDLSFQSFFFLLYMYIYVMYFFHDEQPNLTKPNEKKNVYQSMFYNRPPTRCVRNTHYICFLLLYCLITSYSYSSSSFVLKFMFRHKGNDEIRF